MFCRNGLPHPHHRPRPTGNASSSLGIDTRDLEHTIYDVLIQDVALEDAIEPTAVKNLFLAPSNINLAGAEIELVSAFGRESRLKNAIAPVAEQWDFILIDCPPSVGLLTVNALTAANEILTPVQTEYIPLEGIDILLKNLHLIRKNLNPLLPDPRFLCVMYMRNNLADQVIAELRGRFAERVYETVIPRNVRLSEAPSFGQPITTFDSSSTGAKAYRAAAKEIANGA